jgi:hypothetical protein
VAVVDSVSNDSIRFGESMGSPKIPKSDFPLPIGNSSISHWPIKIAENEFGQIVLTLSERALSRFDGFYIYLEKHGGYIPANLNLPNQTILFSHGFIEAFFLDTSFNVYFSSGFHAGDPIIFPSWRMQSLRPDTEKETPNYYIVDGNGKIENIQAWSNRLAQPEDYSLGRDVFKNQANFISQGSTLNKFIYSKDMELEAVITIYPESIVFEARGVNAQGPDYDADSIRTSGNPAFFLETSRTKEYVVNPASGLPILDAYPNFFTEERSAQKKQTFTIKFPKLDLPSSARVTGFSLEGNIRRDDHSIFYFLDDSGEWVSATFYGNNWDSFEWENSDFINADGRLSLSSIETLRLAAHPYYYSDSRALTLIGLQVHLKVRIPVKDAKLYASGIIADPDFNNTQLNEDTLIPSIKGLLSAAYVEDYSVRPIGELNDIKYGHIIYSEATLFRDKLRSLAAESATLVKFSPAANELLVKSVSRQFEHHAVFIPPNAVALKNNRYDFKMESPYRNDILSSISISWGKDFETGKYENILYIDPLSASSWDARSGKLGSEKWDPVLRQLEKNSRLNIGTVKNINSDWVTDLDGAEIMAYNFLCWNCAPLRKAQANCITPALRMLEEPVDIGSFVSFALPGYPLKFAQTAWVVTGIQDDLDGMVSSLELLEAWNMPASPPDRFLLLEDGGNIFAETGQKIKLEDLHA